MNIPQYPGHKQSVIDNLLQIPGMLRASDLELKPATPKTAPTPEDRADTRLVPGRQQRSATNEDLYSDDPRVRIDRLKAVVRTPLAASFLDEVLANVELRERIATQADAQGRSWAGVIHRVARQAQGGVPLPAFEADLVRLAVILIATQKLLAASACGEDDDWVYRQTRAARARLHAHHPQASLWLQYALGHGSPVGEQTEKAEQLKALAMQALHGVA